MPNTTSREGFVHSGGFQAGDACETTFIYGLSRLAIRFPCIRHSSDNRGRVVTLTEGIHGFWGGLEAFIRRYPGPESCGSIAIRTQSKQRALWLISRQYSVHDSRSKTPFFARELCIWRYIYCFPLPLLDGNFYFITPSPKRSIVSEVVLFPPFVWNTPFPREHFDSLPQRARTLANTHKVSGSTAPGIYCVADELSFCLAPRPAEA